MSDTFLVAYLTMLSLSGLHSDDEKIMTECGEANGINIGRGNRRIHYSITLILCIKRVGVFSFKFSCFKVAKQK
jgi:hypothetical protein